MSDNVVQVTVKKKDSIKVTQNFEEGRYKTGMD